MRIFILLPVMLIFTVSCLYAQERVTTAGFQFKPIFPSSFFSTGPQKFAVDSAKVNFTAKQNTGFCLGMVVRKGFTKNFSFETGINFVNRKFSIESVDSGLTDKTNFRIISYEIPTLVLLFVQLSRQVYMDVAFGHSLDIFPSDVYSKGNYLSQYGARRNWAASSLLANLGFEYRTEKNGYIYLGASFHRPFKFIYQSEILYDGYYKKGIATKERLSGNYLTVDIRYFFHADPEKRKKKIKKVSKPK
jgi:hypothetical protein